MRPSLEPLPPPRARRRAARSARAIAARALAATALVAAAVGAAAATSVPALARQVVAPTGPSPARPAVRSSLPRNFVIPQTRAFCADPVDAVRIVAVDASVAIREQVATTTLDIRLRNAGPRRLEAELLVPVPDGAVVRGIDFEGQGAEPSAVVLPADEARRIYDRIVAEIRDPALLEFAGYRLVRSSLFPVEPGAGQTVRLIYENLLDVEGDRVDYVLPRSESLDYRVPWSVRATVRATRPIATVYSPSHPIEAIRRAPGAFDVTLRPDATSAATGTPTSGSALHRAVATGTGTPGPFRLSWLLEDGGVTASLVAYPTPATGGGHFLLLGGLPAEIDDAAMRAIRREVTIVVDRSGSMNGEKIEQVRASVLQVLGGLEPGESFQIIPYNEHVETFAPRPVRKDPDTMRAAREYVKGILPRGGTNIHDALFEALRQEPIEGTLSIVLFLTDGLPTVGNTSEAAIRDLARHHNPHAKRIFTIGVGVDVNTPLLEKMAFETRASAAFVLPGEDVEVKVASVFDRLAGPVLASPVLRVLAKDGSPAIGRVQDVLPARLPDLFRGDRIVLLGRYLGQEPLTFEVAGNYLGRTRTFRFRFELDRASTRNTFVPRLWASRKIGILVDAIRELGAHADPFAPSPVRPDDPRVKELVDEIVRLSTEFGVLTEYTAFLAREGTDLGPTEATLGRARSNFIDRAVRVRTGLSSLNQDFNNQMVKAQTCLNPTNRFWDASMNEVEVAGVQQIADRTFYRRNDRWVDSRAMLRSAPPERVVRFGSEEFREILDRLVREGRQGCVALHGDILLEVDGTIVLVEGPEAKSEAKSDTGGGAAAERPATTERANTEPANTEPANTEPTGSGTRQGGRR